MITLGAVTLPPYLLWQDELSWAKVEQGAEYLLSGSLEIQTGVKLAGRPITLVGEQNRGWIVRSTLLALLALTETPQVLTLDYHGREFQVRFRFGDGAVSATPIVVRIPPRETDKYNNLIIRLLEV